MTQLFLPVNIKDHVYGKSNAPLELVEYGDYECPYCGKAYPIVKNIQQELGSNLKLVFRNFPLSKIHPHAFSAAVATEAAARQDKFWEMHDIVFENQKILSTEKIIELAKSIELDMDRFQNDMQQKELADKVSKDFERGMRSGVNRTPTFFVNGKKYEGDWWIENEFLQYLESELASVSVSQQ